MALTGIEHALDALDEPQAAPLDPEMEERLHALLAERVAPLLLRCLQTWEGGAGAFGWLWCVAACLQRGRPASVFLRRAPCACTECSALGLSMSACACRSGLQSTGGLGGCPPGCLQAAPGCLQSPCMPALLLPFPEARPVPVPS